MYDVFDNSKTVTDPRGLVTTYTYNGFGEMNAQVSSDPGTTTYQYDTAGNRISQTDAREITTTYQWRTDRPRFLPPPLIRRWPSRFAAGHPPFELARKLFLEVSLS